MTVPTKLARTLNWYKRMLMGAIGTTSWRTDIRSLEITDQTQASQLAAIAIHSWEITRLLKAQVARIEDFYLTHGSDNTKNKIIRRRVLALKLSHEMLTEEEYEEYNKLFKYN